MDLNLFYSLGFTRNEAVVYLSLVEQGKAPVQILARRLRLPRSTIYSVVETLAKRNAIRPEKIKGRTFYRVDSPAALLDPLQQEEQHLRERRLLAKNLVEELSRIFKQQTATPSPRVELHEGKAKVERFLFDNLDRWTQSMLRSADKSTWGFQDHTFVETFPAWLKKAWKVLHEETGIAGRLLSNRESVEKSLRGKIRGREVRVLGNDVSFESSFWVLGEYVILIMTRESPIYAFQIHDRLLAANLKVLFKHLYDGASPLI